MPFRDIEFTFPGTIKKAVETAKNPWCTEDQTVGASLLAMASDQPALVLTDTPLS